MPFFPERYHLPPVFEESCFSICRRKGADVAFLLHLIQLFPHIEESGHEVFVLLDDPCLITQRYSVAAERGGKRRDSRVALEVTCGHELTEHCGVEGKFTFEQQRQGGAGDPIDV